MSLKHLGIIMDGNGRWASKRKKDRFWGHLRGAKVAQKVIEECSRRKVETLTLFAFSTENWKRPQKEISFLMHLLQRQLKKERYKLVEQNIRFATIGDTSQLPQIVQSEVQKTIEATRHNTGMNLIFALSYGARQEITTACQRLAQKIQSGELSPEEITDKMIEQNLETAQFSDPDLILRTSGEFRLSNFLLWQAAYSEFFISQTLWPDFTIEELDQCFQSFNSRERRFGAVVSSPKAPTKTQQNSFLPL